MHQSKVVFVDAATLSAAVKSHSAADEVCSAAVVRLLVAFAKLIACLVTRMARSSILAAMPAIFLQL